MVATGQTYKQDLPPYSTMFGHYKQWCEDGILNSIMANLHEGVRKQVKKNTVDNPDSD